MYIKIDSKKRVTMQIEDRFAEGLPVDNVTSFKVESIPEVNGDERLCFDANTRTFYAETITITEEQRKKAEARRLAGQKKAAALKWLTDNDWKVNKHTLGEWTDDDPRWLEYLEGREKARAEYDAAVAEEKEAQRGL